MINLNTYLNESIFDDEDTQMNRLDDITKFGNIFEIDWYDMSDDHTFPYMFKPSVIKKAAHELGYFNNNRFYRRPVKLTGNNGLGFTKVKNTYMLPLATIIGHVQYDKNIEVFEKRLRDEFEKYERGLNVLVSVEDKSISRTITDDRIDVIFRVVVESKTKYIKFRFRTIKM